MSMVFIELIETLKVSPTLAHDRTVSELSRHERIGHYVDQRPGYGQWHARLGILYGIYALAR